MPERFLFPADWNSDPISETRKEKLKLSSIDTETSTKFGSGKSSYGRLYSNEHEPIHVHAKKGEFESKAEFYIVNGIIREIKITPVKGAKPLKGQNLKDFESFLEMYADKIVEKWINYFVYHKEVKFRKS